MTEGFRLQDQIEGTENRIAVARRDYIDAVKDLARRTFGNLVAGIFGFKALPQLEAATSEGDRFRRSTSAAPRKVSETA